MGLSAIALVDQNYGIAKDGKQPIHIPEDLKRFYVLTSGHTVIYGRKTYEDMGGLLIGRENMILSSSLDQEALNAAACEHKNTSAVVFKDYLSLLDGLIKLHDSIPIKEMFVIGGESIYRQLFPTLSRIYLTVVDTDFQCDQFFPKINPKYWVQTFQSSDKEHKGLTYHYEIWDIRSPMHLLF